MVDVLPARTTWSNWLDNEVFDTHLATPRSEQEVIDLVRLARAESQCLRVVGTGHSSSPLLRTDGILLSLDGMRGVVSTDAHRGRAVVRAGTKIRELGDPLWAGGLSLTNQGEIDRQAIAGAIATGTHGTGLGLRNISSALQRARIVTGTGEVVEIDESTPDELRAAQVAIGMLGVMTEIELAVSPAYELTEWIGFAPYEEIQPHLLDLARSHRNFSILWLPTHRTAINWQMLPPGGRDGADMCFIKVYDEGEVDAGPIADFGAVQSRDRSYRIYPDDWEPLFYEMEYMLPLDDGLACLPHLRELIRRDYPGSDMPVEVRFVAADDAYLSQNNGRASTVLSVSSEVGKPIGDFFDRCEELFVRHGGRPHWGKIHTTTAAQVREQFPDYERFCRIRRAFDPDGVFLNGYLEPLFA